MTTPTFTTKRLILRPTTLADAPFTQVLFADFEVVKYLDGNNVPWPYPADGMESFYKNKLLPAVAEGKAIAWTITLRDNTIIGALELRPHSDQDNRGFWLGTAYHGQGYMSEALVVTTDYAFDVLGMKQILLANAAPNAGSRRIKEIQGAVLIETDMHKAVIGDVPRERWRLTPEAWRASQLKQKFG